MLHLLITLALLLHGVGHAVGFWTPAPTWWAVAWLLPGIGFIAGACAFWRRADWWPIAVLASAVLSLLLVLPTGALAPGPLASAFAFDLLLILALLLPWSRRLVAGRWAE